MDSNQIGCLAEYKFATAAMEQGFFVSFPLLNSSRYDCIIETPKGLIKIQIKSVHNFSGRSRVFLKDTKQKNYKIKDVDFFAIYYKEKDGFFIIKNDGIKKSIELTSPKYLKYFNNFAEL
jgi:hypothetical protein